MPDKHKRPTGRIRAVRLLIERGAECYDPQRHLARLTGTGLEGIWAKDEESRNAATARLRRALRSERHRGRSGHWSYDLNRHIGLLQALKAEIARGRNPASGSARNLQPTAAAVGMPATARTAPDMSETGTETS